MVPIAKPSLVTIALLDAITCWNSFMWTMLMSSGNRNIRTLPYGLTAFTSEAGVHYNLWMAGATIVVIPMIILFLICRKSIITGVSRGGLKG
jgi:multiple sugar transport system permease protein